MIRESLIALALLFTFGVAWFIAVPLFDTISALFLNISEGHGWSSASDTIRFVTSMAGNALAWLGVLGAAAVIIWLFVYAYRREVDTFEG